MYDITFVKSSERSIKNYSDSFSYANCMTSYDGYTLAETLQLLASMTYIFHLTSSHISIEKSCFYTVLS